MQHPQKMKTTLPKTLSPTSLGGITLALLVAAAPLAQAQTWTWIDTTEAGNWSDN